MNPGVDGESAFAEMGGTTAPKDNMAHYFSKLVGVTFEGRQEVIKVMSEDDPIRVRREADNEYDKNAVAVDVNPGDDLWLPIGYIAKDKNSDIAAALDAGKEVSITIASLTGGGKKTYGVNTEIAYTKVGEVKEPEPLPLVIPGDTLYNSRILGRSIYLDVVNGHKRLNGYSSGSSFPKKFYPEFDSAGILKGIAEKHKVDPTRVETMWGLNGEASTSFGNSIHIAMENYDTFRHLGDKIKTVKTFKTKDTVYGPNKALSRNPFLKKIVEDFHSLFGGDYVRFSEQFIWLESERLCGSIDRLKIIDADKKIVRIQDFKTDGDIHDKRYQLSDSPFKKEMGNELLDYHWLQLSFYAYILKQYGYTVEGLDVFWVNPNKLIKGENPWEQFSSEVIDITKGL